LTMPGGRDPANAAFGKALRLDKSFKEKIDAARKEAKLVDSSTRPASRSSISDRDRTIGENGHGVMGPDDARGGATTQSSLSSSNEPKDPSRPVVGPQLVGELDPSQWGKQTPEQME